jgi:MraZ protein
MFIGRFYHTLDSSGRCSMPKSFREQEGDFIVTRGLDGGLFIFKQSDFAQEAEKLSQQSFTKKDTRDFVRLMANDAHPVSPDANGRIQLPQHLIEFAELEKDVVFVGSISRAEVWDRDTYHDYVTEVEERAEDIAERVGGQDE